MLEASVDKPYLAIGLTFEPGLIAELLKSLPSATDDAPEAGFAVGPVSRDLIEAWTRMIRLVEHPADIPVLAPLIEKEILYRLMQGPQGRILRQISRSDSRISQIRRALAWIRAHFDEPPAHRGHCKRGWHEPGDLPQTLQGSDCPESHCNTKR